MLKEYEGPSCPQNSRYKLYYETQYILEDKFDLTEECYSDVTVEKGERSLILTYPLNSDEQRERAGGAATETLELYFDEEGRIESVVRLSGENVIELVPGEITQSVSSLTVGTFVLWFDTESADFERGALEGFTLTLHYSMALREMSYMPEPPEDDEWDECVRLTARLAFE